LQYAEASPVAPVTSSCKRHSVRMHTPLALGHRALGFAGFGTNVHWMDANGVMAHQGWGWK
jgi:hypothetical protein